MTRVPYKRLVEYMRQIAKRHNKPMVRGGKVLDSERLMQKLMMQCNKYRKALKDG